MSVLHIVCIYNGIQSDVDQHNTTLGVKRVKQLIEPDCAGGGLLPTSSYLHAKQCLTLMICMVCNNCLLMSASLHTYVEIDIAFSFINGHEFYTHSLTPNQEPSSMPLFAQSH